MTENVPNDRGCEFVWVETVYYGYIQGFTQECSDGINQFTLADLHDAHDDDEGEGQQFASGEDVLHPGGPPHAGAVHPCQQH